MENILFKPLILFVLALTGLPKIAAFLGEEQGFGEENRIVGGTDAVEGKYPWMVALYLDVYICGASIISETAILTAAHCVIIDGELKSENHFYGVVGAVDRTYSNAKHIYFSSITPHPEFDGPYNDLAILQTSAPIPFSSNINRICLASAKTGHLLYKLAITMGWGTTNRNRDDTPSDILQHAYEVIKPHLKCKLYYSFFGVDIPDNVMCAKGLNRVFHSGICSGDSGGPLVLYKYKENRYIEVGINAFVNNRTGCGTLGELDGFTRVGSFTQFIKETATGQVCFD